MGVGGAVTVECMHGGIRELSVYLPFSRAITGQNQDSYQSLDNRSLVHGFTCAVGMSGRTNGDERPPREIGLRGFLGRAPAEPTPANSPATLYILAQNGPPSRPDCNHLSDR